MSSSLKKKATVKRPWKEGVIHGRCLLFPILLTQAFEKERQNKEIIDSWMDNFDGRMKQVFNRNILAEEFIYLILRIISPNLKPVFSFVLSLMAGQRTIN